MSVKIVFGTFYSVTQYKKKIILFLVVAALGSCVLTVRRAQSAEAESTKPLFDNASTLHANSPNFPVKPIDNMGNQELFFKMMLSVLLVIALGVAAIYTSKKFLPKITKLSSKEVRIIETVHLGSRRAVHLLKIGNQKILIGSTNENITKLADVPDVVTDLSSQEMDDNMRV